MLTSRGMERAHAPTNTMIALMPDANKWSNR